MGSNYPDCNKEWGILVHQLPREDLRKALHVLPRNIKFKTFKESGLLVYFSRWETAVECIRRKNIQIDGALYNIYPLVTCLTVYGITHLGSNKDIKTYFTNKNLPVLDLFQILNKDDYRVVLDEPEVLANDYLNLLSATQDPYPVNYYCRLCRSEGHKQYQCLNPKSNESVADSNSVSNSGIRNMTHENVASSSVKRTNQGTLAQSKKLRISNNSRIPQNIDIQQKENEASTSSMPTAAERETRKHSMGETAKNKVARRTTLQRTQRKSFRNANKGAKEMFPCREIIYIIPKIRGVLSSEKLSSFLSTVYCKKNKVSCARNFTDDIPALIQQIKGIISYNKRGFKRGIANKDIKTLEDLIKHLGG